MISPDRIIVGCGNFGGIGSLPDLVGRGDSESIANAVLDDAASLGLFQFDTANSYGAGRSEEILGRWLIKQDRHYRSQVKVATKVGNPHGVMTGESPLSRKEISLQIKRSLQRLNVECIDLYYIHEPDPNTPLDETLEALESALRLGEIFNLGLSNVDIEYVREFLRVADASVRKRIRFVQNEFSILCQRDKDLLHPMLAREQISYVAFSPLAGGLLTGKYHQNLAAPLGSRLQLRPEPFQAYLNDTTFILLNRLEEQAKLQNRKISEIALQFVLETPNIHSVIIGARRREHFENLGFKFE